jgi:ribosomal protein L40E
VSGILPAVVVVAWAVVVLFGLSMLGIIAGALNRARERARGHGHCRHCGARLAPVGERYATTCRRCGRDQ